MAEINWFYYDECQNVFWWQTDSEINIWAFVWNIRPRGALGTTAQQHRSRRGLPIRRQADVTMAVPVAAHANNPHRQVSRPSIGEYSVTYGDTSQMPDYAASVVHKYQDWRMRMRIIRNGRDDYFCAGGSGCKTSRLR